MSSLESKPLIFQRREVMEKGLGDLRRLHNRRGRKLGHHENVTHSFNAHSLRSHSGGTRRVTGDTARIR